jgi:hypothetical protein
VEFLALVPDFLLDVTGSNCQPKNDPLGQPNFDPLVIYT